MRVLGGIGPLGIADPGYDAGQGLRNNQRLANRKAFWVVDIFVVSVENLFPTLG
jgi:hypothetical protein